jgi:2-(1,2-epoxy-1,2-dihydrophenyl)acetyl-CoA isomerase
VRGACAGAAFALACACDLRVCDNTSVFRTAFAAVGVAGDMSGAWTLPRLVGSGQARALFLLNERIGPDQALAMGLVSHVLVGPTFDEEVAAMAARIAGWPPLGLRAMKANFLDAETESLAAYTRLESARHLELLATADVKEAALAFLEKRPPRFQGR